MNPCNTGPERLDQRIEEARERGALERTTKRYALLVDDIATIGSSVVFDAEAKGPASEVLKSQLKNAWRDVRRAAKVARADSSNEHLHKVRIDLKRLQCACEVLGLVAESQPSNWLERPRRLRRSSASCTTKQSPMRG